MRILVIEDEHRIAESIKKGLVQESFAVDLAFDGEQGYDLAASEEYDVIVLDLMLPKMDGISICRELRKEGIQTAVLMLTAKGELTDKVAGLNCGADDYLLKPFAFSELLARIRALARRPKQQLESVLRVQDLSLDSSNFIVERAGKIINLSKKEFALLEYLMRHAGQIISKEQLINHVWDYDSDILPNTVEVYIGYLRNKIDRAFRRKKALIKTFRGFGYRLGEKNV